VGQLTFALSRAREHDHATIIGLIDAAAGWLRTKNTDQWKEPWPSEEDRNHRIRRDLIAGKTWIAWDDGTAAATITADLEDQIWPAEAQRDPAVYVHRLIVNRRYAGQGLGAALLDWAGARARRKHRARWVRIDVWTTNKALHAYYLRQGFEFWGYCDAVGYYPSAALFQKATDPIRQPGPPPFEQILLSRCD
jgi:GNAT superfamily N-acetyltransferase